MGGNLQPEFGDELMTDRKATRYVKQTTKILDESRREKVTDMLDAAAESTAAESAPAETTDVVQKLRDSVGEKTYNEATRMAKMVIEGRFPAPELENEADAAPEEKAAMQQEIDLMTERRRVMTEKLQTTNSGNHKNVFREILIYLLWTALKGLDWWVSEYNLLLYLEWTRNDRLTKGKNGKLAYDSIKFVVSAVCGRLFQYQVQLAPDHMKINPQSCTAVKKVKKASTLIS
jgi:hypothetical protein